MDDFMHVNTKYFWIFDYYRNDGWPLMQTFIMVIKPKHLICKWLDNILCHRRKSTICSAVSYVET